MSIGSVGEETQPSMAAGRWVAMTLGLLAGLLALNLFVAWRMDVFGIFRDPTGRSLVTSAHERKAKYMLNDAYVPANFDALILGASASVNWVGKDLKGYRFYNDSVEGGDGSEMRRFVEEALRKGHYKVALVSLLPAITVKHVLQDGLDEVKRGEALGSLTSFKIQIDVLKVKLGLSPQEFFPDGSHTLPLGPPPSLTARFGRGDEPQDPQSMSDYGAMVQELKDHGVRVIYVVSPLFKPSFEENADLLPIYVALVKRSMPPASIIDFNAPEYAWFRDNPENFTDSVHLSPIGAERLSQALNIEMHKILKDR